MGESFHWNKIANTVQIFNNALKQIPSWAYFFSLCVRGRVGEYLSYWLEVVKSIFRNYLHIVEGSKQVTNRQLFAVTLELKQSVSLNHIHVNSEPTQCLKRHSHWEVQKYFCGCTHPVLTFLGQTPGMLLIYSNYIIMGLGIVHNLL